VIIIVIVIPVLLIMLGLALHVAAYEFNDIRYMLASFVFFFAAWLAGVATIYY